MDVHDDFSQPIDWINCGYQALKKILIPLNFVAENLRKLTDGDLDVQALADDYTIREAAVLVHDFNSLAKN